MPTFGIDDLLVPGDSGPGVIVSALTGGVLASGVSIVNTEFGAILPSGVFAVHHSNTNHLLIYDSSFAVVADVTLPSFPVVTALRHVAADNADTFYIIRKVLATTAELVAVSDAGVIGSSWTVPMPSSSGDPAITVSPDGSVLYYADNLPGGSIYRYDLVNDVPLSNLFTGSGTLKIAIGSELIALPSNGDILAVVRPTTSAQLWEVRRYSSGGVLRFTYGIGNAEAGGFNARLSLDFNDPTTFWVRTFPDATGATSVFLKIDIATGIVIRRIVVQTGGGGILPFSCPFFTLSTPGPVTAGPVPCCDTGAPGAPGGGCSCPPGGGGPTTPPPTGTTPAGHPGTVLPPITPWVPQCAGGGDVPTAADLVDVEDWAA